MTTGLCLWIEDLLRIPLSVFCNKTYADHVNNKNDWMDSLLGRTNELNFVI